MLNQKQKLVELLQILGFQDAHSITTTMPRGFLKNKEESEPLANKSKYRTAILKLLYLTITTRPDIETALDILCRKVHQHRMIGQL